MSNFTVQGFAECNATNFPNNDCLITKTYADIYIDSSANLIGEVRMFTGTTLPNGWLFCDGTVLDAVTYPIYERLYNVIGINYGGTDNTNFKIPDLSQKTPIGSTSVNELYVNYQGTNVQSSGNKTISINQMVEHTHTFASHNHSYTYHLVNQNATTSSNTNTNGNSFRLVSLTSNNVTANGDTGNPNDTSGESGGALDFLPPFTTVSFIIFYGI